MHSGFGLRKLVAGLGALLWPVLLCAQTFEIERGKAAVFRGTAYCPGATAFRVSHNFPSYLFFTSLGASIDFFGNIEVIFRVSASSSAPLGSNSVRVEYEFGDFGITLCSKTFSLTIVVIAPPAPVANFTAAPTFGVTPLMVRFTNQSSGGSVTSRLWDFGDGATSTATNPTHTYQDPGRFTVSLRLTGPGGSDTETKQNYIAATRFPPDIMLSATSIEVTVAENDSTAQALSIGNTGAGELYFSVSSSGVTSANQAGGRRPLLNLDGAHAEQSSFEHAAEDTRAEHELPKHHLGNAATALNAPWLTFTPASGAIDSGGSQEITLTFRTANLSTDTTYQASLIINSNDPDETRLTVPIRLIIPPGAKPKAIFSVAPASGFIGTTFSVDASASRDGQTAADSLQVRWDWEGDGDWDTPYSTAKSAMHRYLSPGTKTIQLEVKDSDGHTALAARNLTVTSRAPGSFSLLAPEHGDTLATLTPTFAWKSSFDPDLADTVRYHVIISTSPSFIRAATDTFDAGVDTVFASRSTLKPNTKYYWKIQARDRWGRSTMSTQSWNFTVSGVTTGVDNHQDPPRRFGLSQNHPNPFNPSTTIDYELPEAMQLTLKVYDLAGREIAVLVSGKKAAGAHSVQFHAANLPSGVYFYRLQAGEFIQTKKLTLMR